MKTDKRVAVYQADWAVTLNVLNLLTMLTRAGYESHLFLYRSPPNFFEIDEIKKDRNVHIHSDWGRRGGTSRRWGGRADGAVGSLLRRIFRNIRDLLLLPFKTDFGILPGRLKRRADGILKDLPCRCHIGIEKKGLIWAGQMGRLRREPVIYYSLELYTWDYPDFHKYFNARRIKYAEERYHRGSVATIIQDAARARHLLADNLVEETRVLYLPVSVLGEPVLTRTDHFQRKATVSKNDTIVLQLGQISERRFGYELGRIAQQFPSNWRLAFHGWGTPQSIRQLRQEDKQGSVLFSLEHLPWDGLYKILTSAHIGLVLYKDHCANDRLTVFASEKMALYLQCGLPVIAFDYEGYRMVEERGFGCCISDLEELPAAIGRIVERYAEYRQNAFSCFKEYYEASRYFPPLQRYFDQLNFGNHPL